MCIISTISNIIENHNGLYTFSSLTDDDNRLLNQVIDIILRSSNKYVCRFPDVTVEDNYILISDIETILKPYSDKESVTDAFKRSRTIKFFCDQYKSNSIILKCRLLNSFPGNNINNYFIPSGASINYTSSMIINFINGDMIVQKIRWGIDKFSEYINIKEELRNYKIDKIIN